MTSARCEVGGASGTVSWLLAAMLLLVLGAAVTPLQAQVPSTRPGTPATEAIAREAMAQLRSPVTPSHTLDMCPAGAAEALRDTVRMAAAEGQTVNQLVEGVIARYGEDMRILPKRRGVGLWAWILPPAALLLGAGVVFGKLRSLRRPDGVARGSASEMSDADHEELALALREWETSGEESL